MHVTAVKTSLIHASEYTTEQLLTQCLPALEENSIVAISSKIVSLCEGTVVARDQATKAELVKREADLYLPASASRYGQAFTIIKNTLIAVAGIDESNAEDYFILWPKDPQASANTIRHFLGEHFGLRNVGVVITDSTCQPLRRGTTGIVIAYSGFKGLHDYIGQPDLFGRPFVVAKANLAAGIAAAATLAMGEGTEQTPLGIVTDVSFIDFVDHDPTQAELDEFYPQLAEDLFEPFLKSVDWQKKS